MIGHSTGGIVTFDLAARYPGLASAIALVDTPVVRPSQSRAGIATFLAPLGGSDYPAALAQYLGTSLFLPTDDAERNTDILNGTASAPQHVIVATFEGLRDYDPTEATGRITIPILYIAADEAAPRSDMARFQALVPQALYSKTVGSGHVCRLEVPEQVNAMIERFLAIGLPHDV